MSPELFTDCHGSFKLNEIDLEKGYLRKAQVGTNILNLPEIREEKPFKQNIFDTWMKVEIR